MQPENRICGGQVQLELVSVYEIGISALVQECDCQVTIGSGFAGINLRLPLLVDNWESALAVLLLRPEAGREARAAVSRRHPAPRHLLACAL